MGLVPSTDATNLCCIQLSLAEAEAFNGQSPSLEMRDAGATVALYSQINGGPAIIVEDGKEKPAAESSRKVKIRHSKKVCSTGTTTPLTKCSITADAADDPFEYSDLEFTGVYNWKFKLDDTKIRTMCENRAQFYETVVRTRVDAAIQGLNAAILEQLVPLMGKYPKSGNESLTTPITLPIISAAGVPNPAALALIKTQYRQMNQSAPVIHVGAGYADVALNALGYAGLANNGVNTGAFNLNNYFRDENVNAATDLAGTGDNLITWAAGAIKIAEYYQNGGDFVERGPVINVGGRDYFEYEFGRIELGGVVWDFFMKRVCDEWVFAFEKQFQVVGLPGFNTDCQDYNYALRYLMECGDMNCDLITSVAGSTSGSGGEGIE
jgi:hypothetical protein